MISRVFNSKFFSAICSYVRLRAVTGGIVPPYSNSYDPNSIIGPGSIINPGNLLAALR